MSSTVAFLVSFLFKVTFTLNFSYVSLYLSLGNRYYSQSRQKPKDNMFEPLPFLDRFRNVFDGQSTYLTKFQRPRPRLGRLRRAVRLLEKKSEFLDVWDVSGISGVFGRFWPISGVFGRFRTFSDVFERFRTFLVKCFDLVKFRD